MRILVAGAGGYIGIPLCNHLTDCGHKVTGFDRFFFERKPKCETVTLDIRTHDPFKYFPREFDAVVDLCGLSNDASADIDPEYTKSINVTGGNNLAFYSLAQGISRYIYASSASVYGHGTHLNMTETDAANPLTEYAKSKAEMEFVLHKMMDDSFKPTMLRFSTLFGVAPRMRFDLAVNIMTARAWSENIIYVMGGGDQWRPFVHISDVIEAIKWSIESDEARGQIFNVGCENTTIKDLSRIVHEVFPNAVIHNIPDELDKRSYHVSFDKYRRARRGSDAAWMKTIDYGVTEIKNALIEGTIDPTDPTGYTVSWYKQLIEWNERIKQVSIDGRIL